MTAVARTRIAALQRARPKSRLLRASVWVLVALVAYSWSSGEIETETMFTARRARNLERFLTVDAVPYPLRAPASSPPTGAPSSAPSNTAGTGPGAETVHWTAVFPWAGEIVTSRGWSAMLSTLGISVLAIALAGAFGVAVMALGSSSLMTREPFLMKDGPTTGAEGAAWRTIVITTRFGFIFLRSIPEYVWAFLFLAMLGPTAWVAVLALAIHNGGILGRLYADTVENLEAAPLRTLRMLGASRRQISASALLPLGLPRMLLYFFYRFETCVREATVLGMLGVVSLGYYIQEARARGFYDEMLLLVALGVVIVLVGDLVSYVARAWVRDAT